MYSFPNLQPVFCFMYSSNCCFLTCIQVSQEADHMVWYSHFLKNFPQFVVIHTVKAVWSGGCAALGQHLHGAGVTVRRYPTFKGREDQKDGRCWCGCCAVLELWLCGSGATLKRYPTSRPKEKSHQDDSRGKITFRIKHHTRQGCQRTQAYLGHTRAQRLHRD